MSLPTVEHPTGGEDATRTASTTSTARADDVVRLPRRTIDKVLIGFGVIAAGVFATAGGLLTWGSNFSEDYVHDEVWKLVVLMSNTFFSIAVGFAAMFAILKLSFGL